MRPSDVEDLHCSFKGNPTLRGTIARGLGRSYGDAAQNAGGQVIDMTALAAVRALDLETGLIEVDAGMSLDRLMKIVVPLGWFVPVTPGTRFVTIGGAIASDVHGKNHHLDGSFCEHVRSMVLATPAGDVLALTPDHDAFWATAGGMGLTGMILSATLALMPVETSAMRVDTERATDLDSLMTLLEQADRDERYSVAWVDVLAEGGRLGRAVVTSGDHATAAEVREVTRAKREGVGDPLAFSPSVRLRAPSWLPSGLVRRATVAGFNEMWFRRAPRSEHGAIQSIPAFFHPLDGVAEWNRIYGRRGFLQYQLVVPFGAEATLQAIFTRLHRAHCPSFVTVLKRFGDQRGLISFPMPGWTLALDAPTTAPGLRTLLDQLDHMVLDAGGRVYLAKDSRLPPDLLGPMYPNLDRWREVRARLDPAGRMRSDLERRVGLT
ncbi:MAG: FAD-binding protein [Acidimicrobiales bacterium]